MSWDDESGEVICMKIQNKWRRYLPHLIGRKYGFIWQKLRSLIYSNIHYWVKLLLVTEKINLVCIEVNTLSLENKLSPRLNTNDSKIVTLVFSKDTINSSEKLLFRLYSHLPNLVMVYFTSDLTVLSYSSSKNSEQQWIIITSYLDSFMLFPFFTNCSHLA
jgi:hypothetical protein